MNLWRCLRALMLGLVLTVVAGVGVSGAASQSGPLVPGTVSVAGRSYGPWVVAAFRWRLSQPNITSNDTACITAGQHGPIWFLGGSATNTSVITRTCAIPAGRYLMLSTPSVDCSTLEPSPFHATTNVGLMRCAKRLWKRFEGPETVTLDGVSLNPVGYTGGTLAFSFNEPARNNYELAPGRTHGRMAVYGVASIFRPLSRGTHTLVVIDGFRHPSIVYKITYRLAVG